MSVGVVADMHLCTGRSVCVCVCVRACAQCNSDVRGNVSLSACPNAVRAAVDGTMESWRKISFISGDQNIYLCTC